MFDTLNEQEFDGKVKARITWGRMPSRKSRRMRRSIRFGSYMRSQDIIRIHPLLDQQFVPDYFVRYIVFHEMLHAALDEEKTESGRRRVHSKTFNDREQQYTDFERAEAWQNNDVNLVRLLRG